MHLDKANRMLELALNEPWELNLIFTLRSSDLLDGMLFCKPPNCCIYSNIILHNK
jgi:hypothetical protein